MPGRQQILRMRPTKKDTYIPSSSEDFSPGKARLWAIEQGRYIYLLNTDYSDNVSEDFKEGSNTPILIKNGNKDQPLIVVAVTIEHHPILKVSVGKNNYIWDAGSSIKKSNTNRTIQLCDPKEFLPHHRDHRLKYHLVKLKECSAITSLRKHHLRLKAESEKGDQQARKKHDAIDQFLKSVDRADYNSFFSILNKDHEIFIEMTKPRRVVLFNFFFYKRMTQADTHEKTTTYKLLESLKKSDEFKKMHEIIKTQVIANINNFTPHFNAI